MADEGRVDMGMTADAGDVLRSFDRILAKQNKMLAGFTKNAKASQGFTGSLARGLGTSVRQLAGMATSFVSVAGAIRAARGVWNQFQQDVRSGAEEIRQTQAGIMDLMFLGDHLKDPKFRGRVLAESKRTGLTTSEVGQGMYAFESMTPWATKQERGDLWNALVKMRKAGAGSLKELSSSFAKPGGLFPGSSGRDLSNVAFYMLEKASVEERAELAKQAPRMFMAGKVGGLDLRTSAALGAFLTEKTGTAAQAGQGMLTILRKIMLKDPSEAEAIRKLAFGAADPLAGRKNLMERAGIGTADNAWVRLQKLGKLDLTPQNLEELFGERGMIYGKELLGDIGGAAARVADFRQATRSDVDLVGGKLKDARKEPFIVATEAGKRLRRRKEAAAQRVGYLQWENLHELLEAERLEHDMGAGYGWMAKTAGLPLGKALMWATGKLGMHDLDTGQQAVYLGASLLKRMEQGPATTPFEPLEGRYVREAAEALGARAPAVDPLNRTTPGLWGENANSTPAALNNAAQNLRDATYRHADANAHVETPGVP